MRGKREGMDAPENHPVGNETAIRFLNSRLAELLSQLVDMRHGELSLRIVCIDGKLKQAEFSPLEKHRF